jgi:hypothetical protein
MPKTLMMAVGFCLVATVAFGQANTGDAGFRPPSENVITPVPEGALSILYAPSEADDAAYRAAIQAITQGTVDYFDASAGTPDAALLSNYDCVATWTNFAYADNVGFGDNLADYVDGGGTVALGAFTTFTGGNFLSGRIMDSGYAPVWSPSGSNWFFSSNYSGDGVTQLHDNVNAYECTFRDILELQGGGAQDGSYEDGEIAGAYRDDFRVNHNNGSGAVQLGCTGDWAQLVANACNAENACALSARITGTSFGAGDAVRVRVTLQHNKLGTASRPFVITLEDMAGNVLSRRETDPIAMGFGDKIRRNYSVRVPAGTAPGSYRLRVRISGMQQGHVESIRPITVN